MTLTAVPALVPVSATAFTFAASCPDCGGAWLVEAVSRGREDLAHPCREVRAAVYCSACDLEAVVVVVVSPPTRRRHRGPTLGGKRR